MKQRRTWRYGLAIAVAFVALFSMPAYSGNIRVVAVKSADIKPYNDVIEAYRKECNCRVTELTVLEHENNIVNLVLDRSPRAVLAVGTDAFRYLKDITTVPIIYTFISTSEEYGLNGANISGVSMAISPRTYIQSIKKIFPNAKKVGLLYDPVNSGKFVKGLEQSGKAGNLDIDARRIEMANEALSMIETMGSIDLFLMLPDTTLLNSENINAMLLFSFRNRIPVLTFSRKFVDMGAAVGLLIEPADIGRQAAGITRRVLKQELQGPIREYAEMSTLVINRKIMKKMGISITNER